MKLHVCVFFLAFAFFASACEADRIDPDGLPQSAQDLISQNYSELSILRIEQDNDDSYCYEVYLSNGVELYFDCEGVLLKSDQDCSDESGIPEGLIAFDDLPQPIKDYLDQNHAGTSVCYTEKDCDLNETYVYEVVLKDGYELYFDLEADFLFSEKDDENNC